MNGGLRLPFTVYRADKCSIINAQGSMNSQCINSQRFGPLKHCSLGIHCTLTLKH